MYGLATIISVGFVVTLLHLEYIVYCFLFTSLYISSVIYVSCIYIKRIQITSTKNTTRPSSPTRTWTSIIVTADGYEKFMNHLLTEFAAENLLFVTEYVQIKRVLIKRYDILQNLMQNNPNMKFDINLPDQDHVISTDIDVNESTGIFINFHCNFLVFFLFFLFSIRSLVCRHCFTRVFMINVCTIHA